MKKLIGFGIATGLAALLATGVSAETRITYKSAKSGSSYYQMGVEIAEALKKKTDGDIVVGQEIAEYFLGKGIGLTGQICRNGRYVDIRLNRSRCGLRIRGGAIASGQCKK